MPPILGTSHRKFNGTCLCAYSRKTIPLAPIHLFTKQMVPSLCPELLTKSLSKLFSPAFLMHPIKCFLPSITSSHFFFVCLFLSFSLHTFCGLAGVCVNLGSFSNSFYAFTSYQITHSFLNRF